MGALSSWHFCLCRTHNGSHAPFLLHATITTRERGIRQRHNYGKTAMIEREREKEREGTDVDSAIIVVIIIILVRFGTIHDDGPFWAGNLLSE